MSTVSGRPRKACDKCKAQKIRCAGERPICRRCLRLNHLCFYTIEPTLPPKSRSRKSAIAKGVSPSAVTEKEGPPESSQASYYRFPPSPADTIQLDALLEHRSVGIPLTLVSTLVDVYFENAYNASLLLHKRLFLESIEAGTARPHVVLSVCAWAANFYHDASGNAVLKDHGFMLDWAERAGRLVFQEVEDLHEDNIVTFVNLTLLWVSQGSWRRSLLHKGNATQLLYVTGVSTGSSPGGENTFAAELRRRRFWACYLVHCHTTEKRALFEPVGDVQQVPLPWPEDDFENTVCTKAHTYLDAKQANGGVFAELIRVMTLWTSIVALLRNSEISFGDRVTCIHSLSDRLEHWRQQLPTHLKLTPLYMTQSDDFVPNILLINIVYHQSLCGLHASIVPLYSWGGSGDGSWLTARQLSAQVAYEHASKLSAFFDVMLSRYPHKLSATSNFIAHAAHCACIVQMSYLWCRNSTVRALASNNVRLNAKMIHVLAKYWRFASLLEVHLGRLHKLHKRHPKQPEDEPKFSDPETLTNCQTRAINTRATLLEFFGILRRREGGGYVKSGEEDAFRVEDSEGESSSGSSLLVQAGRDSAPYPPPQTSSDTSNLDAGINIAPLGPYEYPMSGVQALQEDPSSMALLSAQWPNLMAGESQTFDVFYPFLDPGYLDLLGDASIEEFQGNVEE